jgi:hypothetical protein
MLLGRLSRQLTNAQCFFIEKPGVSACDSRDAGALAAELRLLSAESLPGANCWRFRIQVKNVGEAVWLTQTAGIGRVNLGVQLMDRDGGLAIRDFRRISLGASDIEPGRGTTVQFVLALAEAKGHLRFDLVSEMVCWFSEERRSNFVEWGHSKPPGIDDV